MVDYSKYVGIPFAKHGRSIETGFDCFGLMRHVMNTEFGFDLDDYRVRVFNNKDIQEKIHEKIYRWTEVETPEESDCGIFAYDGYEDHVALYIGNGMILHVLKTDGLSCIERVNSPRLKGRLVGWYRFENSHLHKPV